MRTLFPLVLLSLIGCKKEPDPISVSGSKAIDGVQVQMRFDRPDSIYDAPFPSDDLVVDGRVDLSQYPNPDDVVYTHLILDVLEDADGFGTTSGVFFQLDGPVAPELDVHDTLAEDSPVFLVALDDLERVPVDVHYEEDGGPFGTDDFLSLLPLQGVPLRPSTQYAAVVLRSLNDADGEPLGVSQEMADLSAGDGPDAYVEALKTLEDAGFSDISGLAVFTTWDPVEAFDRFLADARALPTPEPLYAPQFAAAFDDYCVFESEIEMPVYQSGDPPYEIGGAWAEDAAGTPQLQRMALSRMWVTVPRRPMPANGWPLATMIRTGGGGDVPLVERGFRPEAGGPVAEDGTGPALHFARGGWAGFTIDGPHGGPRNVTGADEQFLMFNITNPVATRDNVRQSALEIALLPDVFAGLEFDVSDCPDINGTFSVDSSNLALMGHSMGATIAPLALAGEPRFGASILSGAGGSYIHNLVYKESPLEVKPLAEAMLNYGIYFREIHEHDPMLSVVQWAAESSDPPVYGARIASDILVLQGIVDTYILPPMANALNLSLGNDLAGESLDAGHADLQEFQTLESLLSLVGANKVDLPASGSRFVVQHPQGPIEDGHEVMFQTAAPQHQYRCFLESILDGAPIVPVGGQATDSCD